MVKSPKMMYNYSCLGNLKAALAAVWNNTQIRYNYISPFVGVAVFPRQEPMILRRVFLFGGKSQVTTGIYYIISRVNGKRYVGSSINVEHRFVEHRHRLRLGKHHSIVLQRAWNKYGEENFEFKVIVTCKPEELIICEQKHIDYFSVGQLYNTNIKAGSRLGMKHTSEAKRKMSLSQTGKVLSGEIRLKISKANSGKGHLHTPETRAKLSAMKKGKPFPYEQKTGKRIDQIDFRTGKVLQSFVSISEAARATRTDRRSIQRVLCGKLNKVKGCQWRYCEN